MKGINRVFHKSILALILALCLALPGGALAAGVQAVQLYAQWTDAQGYAQMAEAQAVPYQGYENRYWVTVPAEAIYSLTVQAIDLTGKIQQWQPDAYTPLASLYPALADAGSDLGALPVDIVGYNAEGQEAARYSLYLSTQPLPPDPSTPVVINPAPLTIHYRDESGAPVTNDSYITVNPGYNAVGPQEYISPEDYELISAASVDVNVDENGANPSEITFTYRKLVKPATVTVHYADESGMLVANDSCVSVNPGYNAVGPQEYINPEDYELISAASVDVNVDENGANPSEITFTYRKLVKPATVTVHYADESGMLVANDSYVSVNPGYNAVGPQEYISPEDYELISAASVDVNVDENGADPSEITFTYRKLVKPATVTVHYADESGMAVATDTFETLSEGAWLVNPQPTDLLPNYEITGEDAKQVTVGLNGAEPSEITFVYRLRPADPATLIILYVDGETGLEIASRQTAEFAPGSETQVFPAPADLLPDYVLTGPDSYTITVTDRGQANMDQIVFQYQYVAPATEAPTEEPTPEPTEEPTPEPTEEPTPEPTEEPTPEPTEEPTPEPTEEPTPEPTEEPTAVPTEEPTPEPTEEPTPEPTEEPTPEPTEEPTPEPTEEPTAEPTEEPTAVPTEEPTPEPTEEPTAVPTEEPTPEPTEEPTAVPTEEPTPEPTQEPTAVPTEIPTETPVPGPVAVRVRYVDQENQAVADAQTVLCALGDSRVIANPVNLMENYALDGDDSVIVHVDENGAQPAEVVFTYREISVVPKVALVGVKYLRPSGEAFFSDAVTCAENAENVISINWSLIDPAWGYELASPESVTVTVDRSGAATPAEVIFQFKNEVNAEVTIRFQDAATGLDVASPQQQLCYVGNNSVLASPIDLKDNYQLIGNASQNVVLSQDGALTPAEAVFLYQYVATPSPIPGTPTPIPYDEILDTYCRPYGNNINFRSSPTTAENNVIGTVNQTDVFHVVGKVTTADRKTWYAVEKEGQTGYLHETVVKFLSDAEIAALFNFTPAPTAVPTPAPSDIPDGAVIDRWAYTNASVNFRKSPEVTGSNRIGSLDKNTRLWVYSSQTVNDEKWYSVRANGADGFLMAQFVDVASAEDSQQIQQSLTSPMPTQVSPATPAPTQTPTDAPTPDPTLAPTGAPTETPYVSPSPVPYRGYALTVGQAALRTGVSMTDDSILQIMPENSLMYISGQTWVDGTAWASVQSVANGNLGFMRMDSLQTISNDQARPYLDQIQATVPPVTATPVPEQQEGYAMTLGDGVPMRVVPDTNGEIILLLPYTAVANVRGQTYTDTSAWHLVQYNGLWGYIRQDQMRMLSAEETQNYLDSLSAGTPTPSPAPTPEPVTQESLSSYGHVQSNSGKVNLRSGPSTQSNRVRLLDNYAFALVMGSVTNEEGTWYHVSQAGTEGYILSNYFKVLSLGELSDFLQSSEYLNANGDSGESDSSASIQPVEDYNRTVWQNPALTASYEPFNPFITPTPDPEHLPTETPAPTESPAPSPTPEIAPVDPDAVIPENNVRQGGSAWPWVLLGLAAVGGGGAYYYITKYRKEEQRRQAARAQQARQQNRSGASHPQMRAAQNNPTQVNRPSYPAQSSAPFMPPQGGAPRPAQTPNASAGGQSGNGVYQPTVKTDTQAYQPPRSSQSAQDRPTVKTDTQAYQPVQSKAASADTQAFKPAQSAPASQETQAFKPASADSENASTLPHQRQRRSDRHKNG